LEDKISKTLLLAIILVPLIGSVVVFAWGRYSKKTAPIVSTVFSGAALTVAIALYVLSKGQAIKIGLDVGLPFDLALKADALGLFLTLITTSIWFLVTLYSVEYIHDRKGIFGTFMHLSLFGMLGITLSENLFTLLLFFEIFSLASTILIIHEMTKEAIKAGFQYLFMSVLGTGAIIAGSAIVYSLTGSVNLLDTGLANISITGMGALAFWLLMLGFAIKAGVFPVHIWLPQAHPIAPSAASALLSGIMIKAGAYGIIRVIYGIYSNGGDIIIGSTFTSILIVIAVITMIGGSIAAITQGELKKMLAYSSVAQIGYVLLGAALLSKAALTGGVLHILNHAIMKSALFLAAGAIIHKTGKRNLKDLKGIGKTMPFTMTVITLSAISMIGIPPFLGFFSKWLLAKGALDAVTGGIIQPWAAYTIVGAIVLSGLLNVVYYGPILINGWFGGKEERPAHAHGHDEHHEPAKEKVKLTEPSWVMVAPMMALAISTLVLGIYIKYPLKLVASVVKIYFKV